MKEKFRWYNLKAIFNEAQRTRELCELCAFVVKEISTLC